MRTPSLFIDAPIVPAAHARENHLHVLGDGDPLLYVPGMDGTGLLFYRQAIRLRPYYRVGTYRLRDSATTMAEMVDDCASVMRELAPDGERIVVVGESFGGALSMSTALAYPERVKALVILNSFPYFDPHYRLWLALHGLQIVPWGTMRFVRRLTATRLHSAHTHREEIQRFLMLTRGTTREGYLNRLRILQQYDVRERLGALTMPVLFLAANRDHLIPSVQQATRMAARAPNATVRVLDGHGHSAFLAPDLDLKALLDEWQAVDQTT